jgi:hypothetical protein
MSHRLRPTVEAMESRTVLSAIGGTPAAPVVGVSVHLATDRAVYRAHQPVRIVLTETNTSTHDVEVPVGPSIPGFSVTRGGTTVWRASAGIQAQYIAMEVLHPGQSVKLSATWNGRSNVGRPRMPAGLFVAHTQIPGVGSVVFRVRRP